MPEGLRTVDRHQDPYGWALAQARLLRRAARGLNSMAVTPE